jgi:hypothetical protein
MSNAGARTGRPKLSYVYDHGDCAVEFIAAPEP